MSKPTTAPPPAPHRLAGEDAAAADGITTDDPMRICPITGWAVWRRPEWTRVVFEEGFSITAEIIGGCVLITHNQGRATREGVRKAFAFTDAIIAEHFNARPYIHILDYTHLAGTSLEGRRSFIRRMLKRQQMAGVVFYGLSPMLRMSTKLGKRLRIIPFNVHIAQNYTMAVSMAQETRTVIPKSISNLSKP